MRGTICRLTIFLDADSMPRPQGERQSERKLLSPQKCYSVILDCILYIIPELVRGVNHSLENLTAAAPALALSLRSPQAARHPFCSVTVLSFITALNRLGSAVTLPMMLTAEAGIISSPRLMGVGPKNMQKARPVGQ